MPLVQFEPIAFVEQIDCIKGLTLKKIYGKLSKQWTVKVLKVFSLPGYMEGKPLSDAIVANWAAIDS